MIAETHLYTIPPLSTGHPLTSAAFNSSFVIAALFLASIEADYSKILGLNRQAGATTLPLYALLVFTSPEELTMRALFALDGLGERNQALRAVPQI